MPAAFVPRVSGWRGLGLFWAAVVLIAGGGAATLSILGPPKPRVVAETRAPAARSAEEAPPYTVVAPQAALLEASKGFPAAMLPRVGADGRVSRVAYARGFDRSDTRPRIAILITGAGMSDANTKAAIAALPGPVSFAFSPYAATPDALLELCRKAGHELLVSIPMESQGYPLNDAGSRSLMSGAPLEQNSHNLEWALSRIQGYVGAVGALDAMRGERFAEQSANLKLVLDDLSQRGLLYVDPRPDHTSDALTKVPGRDVDLVVDDPPARAEIEAKLAALERLAKSKGSALGLAGPLRPVTVERISAWAKTLDERGFALAPVSAVIPGAGR